MSGVETAHRLGKALYANLGKVILGKTDKLFIPISAILSGGHILCTDVPGVGKTVLSKAIARSLGCSFSRLQCTADLLPSDIIGVTIFNQKTSEFELRRGPVFSQVFLADEINRATPKAQSALLECMEERQVTIDGHELPLTQPFIVLATQNPIEYEGTFPLPEAQLDRFMVSLSLGYPAPDAESAMLSQQQHYHPLEDVKQITSAEELRQAHEEVRQVSVSDSIVRYIVALVNHTRRSQLLSLGSSPRGSQALFRGAQALAAMQNRQYVIPDDVQALAKATLQHRLIPQRRHDRAAAQQAVEDALSSIPVPVS